MDFRWYGDHITLKDPKRAFPRELVEQVLTKQNFKDYIDGKELYLDNAVGAHIISHKDGGRTEPSNLRVTSIEHNRRMGMMNLEQYKKLYLDNQHQSWYNSSQWLTYNIFTTYHHD